MPKMNDPTYTRIIGNGLWLNNPGLVQLLGLCPLLAVTTSVVNGLGLGLATTLTLVCSNVTVSLIRRLVRPEVRIPVFVLVIASTVTVIELLMNAWLHELYNILGIFIPLIVTNCVIIGRAEAFASRNSADRALLDGLAMGIGFTCVLVTLGGLRELLGHGTLLAHAHLMFGEIARDWTLTLIPDYRGFLLAILPPGAFLGLGLLIAGKNLVDARQERRARAAAPGTAAQPSGAA
jgi:electron transport complex protein RnfE